MPLLVRVPNWLGDVVMSLPALAGLVKDYPGTVLWAHDRVAGLLPLAFPGTTVLGLDVIPRDADRVLLLTDSWSSAWKALRTGAGERMGYGGEFRGPLLTRRLRRPKGRIRHHSEDYSALARFAGAEPGTPDLSAVVPSGGAHVALFPGSRYGPAKLWAGFGELAPLLATETGLPVVLYGTGAERELLEAISTASGGGASVETGLGPAGLASQVASAVLAVGNDSGGVHLSAALGVPTLTIFGSTSPVWTAPRGRRTDTVQDELECSPCFRRKCPRGEPARCLEMITVGRVLARCRSLMGVE